MDKLTVISGCLFLAADIFAIASIANPDWISTGDSAGRLLLALCPEKVELFFFNDLFDWRSAHWVSLGKWNWNMSSVHDHWSADNRKITLKNLCEKSSLESVFRLCRWCFQLNIHKLKGNNCTQT